MNYRLHHVALTVNNIEESTRWYEDKLGFKKVNSYNNEGMEIALLQLGEVRLELFNFGKETRSLPESSSSLMEDLHVVGTKHLCIEVDNLLQKIEELKRKGMSFLDDIETPFFGGKYIFFKDCNGILIELYQA